MWNQTVELILSWQPGDTRVVIAGALAAMACALPGNFLLVRRQSMMGDAISHTVLPGIVLAFLAAHALKHAGWIAVDSFEGWLHFALISGAVVLGVACAVMTEWVQRIGRVESSAALGVVFTTLFALGLLLLRLKANDVHLDPDCVLFGSLEALFLNGETMPRAYWVNGSALVINLVLVCLFFKELRFSSFDPNMATAMGYNASLLHYGLMAGTAATLVAAFETVGSILVIAMLITPAATAYMLTDSFPRMIALSLVIAALAAVLGRLGAIVLPSLIFPPLGYPMVDTASTSGMMAVSSAFLLFGAVMLGPRYGLLSRAATRLQLAIEIAAQDILGRLYRLEEDPVVEPAREPHSTGLDLSTRLSWRQWFAVRRLLRRRDLVRTVESYQLTATGRESAQRLVRSHRLFESYMAKHFELPDDHLHDAAEVVEHFLDAQMLDELTHELDAPDIDPHGRSIPHPAPPAPPDSPIDSE